MIKKIKTKLILFLFITLIATYSRAIYEGFQIKKETDTIMVILREIFDEFVDSNNWEKAIICLDQYFTNESYYNAAGYLLCGAAKNNNLDVIRFVLEKQPEIVNKEYGYQSLNEAIINKNEEAINIILVAVLSNLKKDPQQQVLLLLYGFLFNNTDLINVIIKKAAFLLYVSDKYNNTVAHYAAIGNSTDKLFFIFARLPNLKNGANQFKQTPLLYACLYGHTKAIKDLAQRNGYDYFNTGYINNNNCILHALFKNGKRDNINLILGILNIKDFKTLESILDNYGNTVLHTACKEGHLELVIMLLRLNNNLVNILNNKKLSPFDIALKYNKRDIVKFISDYNLELNHVRFLNLWGK